MVSTKSEITNHESLHNIFVRGGIKHATFCAREEIDEKIKNLLRVSSGRNSDRIHSAELFARLQIAALESTAIAKINQMETFDPITMGHLMENLREELARIVDSVSELPPDTQAA